MKRASGILLPIASLPSKYGIGCFSREAYDFIDRLKEAGQSYCHSLLPVTGIPRTSHFLLLQAIPISSTWKRWLRKGY